MNGCLHFRFFMQRKIQSSRTIVPIYMSTRSIQQNKQTNKTKQCMKKMTKLEEAETSETKRKEWNRLSQLTQLPILPHLFILKWLAAIRQNKLTNWIKNEIHAVFVYSFSSSSSSFFTYSLICFKVKTFIRLASQKSTF